MGGRVVNLEDGLTILDALGSSDDPIFFKGKEMAFSQLVYGGYEEKTHSPVSDADIRKVNIKFYGHDDHKELKLRRGTVYSMILDRLREMSVFSE